MKNEEKEFKEFLLNFGNKVKEIRNESGLTQYNMAEGIYSIDDKYYQRIEYGQRNITLKTIFKLCKKLGIQPKDLFNIDIEL